MSTSDRGFLLISDLDGTLLGNDAALERFRAFAAAQGPRLRVVYNSGRLFESVCDSVAETALPAPAAVIAGVGTEIRRVPGGKPVFGWPRLLGPWEPDRIRRRIAHCFPSMTLQPDEFQSRYKISYYAHDLSAADVARIRRRLTAAGHAVSTVYSSRRDLDILPAGVNKGSAAAYLAGRWAFPPWRVIVAGDTGNDAAMFIRRFRGIVVGNADAELRALHRRHVYQSRQAFADGVVEGLRHWLTAGCEETIAEAV